MSHAIIFDCEFLVADGAPSRFWCGPYDPDPIIAQIGAVKLRLMPPFDLSETHMTHVIPRGRDGAVQQLDPLFTSLTGITNDIIASEGIALDKALAALDDFADGAKMWSWGKDEFNMIAISCYVAGITPPIPVTRFGNACDLLLRGGMHYDDIKKTRSNQLADFYGLPHPPLQGHDARDDALSVAYVLQHLLENGQLDPGDFG